MARLSNRRLPIRRAETMHGVHTYLALVPAAARPGRTGTAQVVMATHSPVPLPRHGLAGPSAGGDQPVHDPDAELQRVDRHPLVHAVEHAGEVQLGRQP